MRGNSAANNPKYGGKDFFVYELNRTTVLNAGVTANLSFTTDNDSDFMWTKFNAQAGTADDGQTSSTIIVPILDVIITDNSSGRQLMNDQVPLYNIAGSGSLPFILPIERIIKARSTIAVKLINATDNVNYLPVKLSFIGVKLFLA